MLACRKQPPSDAAQGQAAAAAVALPSSVKPRPLEGLRDYPLPDAADGSSPSLAVGADGLTLAWISQAGAPTLRLASLPLALVEAEWSEPQVVISSPRLLVNWADVAAVGETGTGRTIVAWPEYHTDDPSAGYGLRVAAQTDDGSFAPAWSPDAVRRGPESGFVRFIATSEGLRMFWLDGRELGGGGHGGHGGGAGGTMQLRSALIDDDGHQIGASVVIDERTCECCKLDVGLVADQPFVAYRDRSEAEIRDIFVAGPGLKPTRVAADDWTIAGCPVNGPAVASNGALAHVAWFTGAEDRSAMWITTTDSLAKFAAPKRFDLGLPAGRVDLLETPDGGALASWIELDPETPGRAWLLARRLGPDGALGDPIEIAEVGAARDWGFPRTALLGDEVIWVFTDPTPAGGRMRLQARVGPLPGA